MNPDLVPKRLSPLETNASALGLNPGSCTELHPQPTFILTLGLAKFLSCPECAQIFDTLASVSLNARITGVYHLNNETNAFREMTDTSDQHTK